MLRANNNKFFFIFTLSVFLIISIVEVKINTLQFQSSQLSNFLISKNAVTFMTSDHGLLDEKKLNDLIDKYPNVAIMTFQNMWGYRCIGFYSNNLNMFKEYMLSGRFFRDEELREGAAKAIIGKNLFDAQNKYIEIQEVNLRTYAVIEGVSFEVIGVVGGKTDSSLDNLVIVSALNLNTGKYYLDSKSSFFSKSAFHYAKKNFAAEELENQSNILNTIIRTDMQFGILKILQSCIKLILVAVLIYFAEKTNRDIIYVHYMIGFPFRITIKESYLNILSCSLFALLPMPFILGMGFCSLSESFWVLTKYLSGIAVVLLVSSFICLKVYYIKSSGRLTLNE